MYHTALKGERLLNRYRVIEILTTGGFGLVYICWDEKLKRRIAIKAIPLTDKLGVPLGAAMPDALAEARTAGFLSHPCIVNMLDFEEDVYHAYLIMEHIEGCTLAELIKEGGIIPFDEAAHIIDSVAQALSFAHDNGVLHLDIKPENILIDRAGNVKLADFGMANLASAAGYADARGGSIGYMPPEQLQSRRVDERTDVFAFAAVVFEMLSARAPFKASNLETSEHYILEGAPDLQLFDPEAPLSLDLKLHSALSPMPDIRPQSVQEFAESILPELGNIQAGKSSLVQTIQELHNDNPQAPELPIDTSQDFEPAPIDKQGTKLKGYLARVTDSFIYGGLSLLAFRGFDPLYTQAFSAYVIIPIIVALISYFFGQLGFMLALTLSILSMILQIFGAPLFSASSLALVLVSLISCVIFWLYKGRKNAEYLRVLALSLLCAPLSLSLLIPYLAGLVLKPRSKLSCLKDALFLGVNIFLLVVISKLLVLLSGIYLDLNALTQEGAAGILSQDPFFGAGLHKELFSLEVLAFLCICTLGSFLLAQARQLGLKLQRQAYSRLQDERQRAEEEADNSIERHYQAYESYKAAKRRSQALLGILCIGITIMNSLLLAVAYSVDLGSLSLQIRPAHGIVLIISAILYFCIYIMFGQSMPQALPQEGCEEFSRETTQ